MAERVGQQLGNAAAGLVRGPGSIGATILSPRDALEGFIARQMGAPELAPQDRRAAMDAGLAPVSRKMPKKPSHTFTIATCCAKNFLT